MSKRKSKRQGEKAYEALTAFRGAMRNSRKSTKATIPSVLKEPPPQDPVSAVENLSRAGEVVAALQKSVRDISATVDTSCYLAEAGLSSAVKDIFRSVGVDLARVLECVDTPSAPRRLAPTKQAGSPAEAAVMSVRATATVSSDAESVSAAAIAAARSTLRQVSSSPKFRRWSKAQFTRLTAIGGQSLGTRVGEGVARVYLDEAGFVTEAPDTSHTDVLVHGQDAVVRLDAKFSVGECGGVKTPRWQFNHLSPDKSDFFMLMGASESGVTGWLVPFGHLLDLLEGRVEKDTSGISVCRESKRHDNGNIAVKVDVGYSPECLKDYLLDSEHLTALTLHMLEAIELKIA